MKLGTISESHVDLKTRLIQLKPSLAQAAQSVYDLWEQGDDGIDEEFGGGGICDAIANQMSDVLSKFGVNYTEGGHDGDDHAWLVAYDDYNAYAVDVSPHLYETGGGMSWYKIPNVIFTPDMVDVYKIDRPDWIDD